MPARYACVRLAAALVLLSPLSAWAQSAPAATSFSVPRLINVSSVFQPADGQPPAAVEVVTLSIYADPEGGVPLWQETQTVAVDRGGRFNVLLGATFPDGIPPQVFASSEPQWMSMRFARTGEVERPRVRITSVPYALKASDAETLGGLPPAAFLRAPLTGDTAATASAATSTDVPITPSAILPGTTNYLAKYVDSADVGTSAVYETPTAMVPGGAVGIGTTAPADLLHLRFNNTNGQITGLAVQNLGNTAASYSGMLFYDQFGALAQFQGFNNVTHEYRVNNVATNGSINLMTGKTSRLFVASTGNVGIGTVIPQAKLDVNGASNLGGSVYIAGNVDLASYGTNPDVRLNVGGPSAGTSIETSPVMQLSRPAQSGIKNTNSAGFSVGAFETGILGRTRLDVKLSGLPTDSNTYGTIPDVTVMSMLADGRVGIGTTNPLSKLEVRDGSVAITNGNASVTNGNVAISNGALRVIGAGANTNTSVFIHVVTNESQCGDSGTVFDHPYTNNDPNAILLITQSAGTMSGQQPVANGNFFLRYGDENVGCAIAANGLNKWMIYSGVAGGMPVGARFNVMVIKP